MDKLRALVRPVVTLSVMLVILLITVILVLKYSDAELAKSFAIAVLTTGNLLIGYWFGQRKAQQ